MEKQLLWWSFHGLHFIFDLNVQGFFYYPLQLFLAVQRQACYVFSFIICFIIEIINTPANFRLQHFHNLLVFYL